MRKTDQELIWEAFAESSEAITSGGPLKAGGGKTSTPRSSDDEEDVDGDPYEDEETEGLMGLVAQLLQGVEDGSIDEAKAIEHIKMVLGDEGEHEDESSDENEDEDEEKNIKRGTAQKATDEMRGQFTKDKSAANVKRPQPNRSVEGIKGRDTSHYQQGM